jgi:hypothetical protein
MHIKFSASCLFFLSASFLIRPAYAQQAGPQQLSFVMPKGKGRLIIPAQDVLRLRLINLYDNGTRPVLQATTKSGDVSVSYALFPNSTGSSAPKICRDDVLDAAVRGTAPMPALADIKQVKKFDHLPINGQPVEMGSFFVAKLVDAKVEQQNLFAVAASPTACAEIHISKSSYKPTDEPSMIVLLDTLNFEPDYVPSAQDYYALGTAFYNIKSFESAAFYYQSALDTLPQQASRNIRRLIVDQLSMSYGISGNIKQSRAIIEDAIKIDPDYPLFYYNLACADAEQGKTKDAQLHLQQAFDRKANTLRGETLPDPTHDDSIQKLKKNKEFWAFVQTLK